MKPDPVAKLAQFTPAPVVDPAELLFAAGRASARTPRGWKAAVVVLGVSNAALTALLVGRPLAAPPAPPPEPIVRPVPPEPVEPAVPSAPASAPPEEPWSYLALRAADPDRLPQAETLPTTAAPEPLTALSGRRGDID
jgi:hypothetical protein